MRDPVEPMKVGITLPQFRDEADSALAAARRAEALGIDGVFCFDHLWPMGQPGGRPSPRARCSGRWPPPPPPSPWARWWPGSACSPTTCWWRCCRASRHISGGRLIAGIGTGDHLSRAENLAFGIPFEPAAERRVRLAVGGRRRAGRGHPGLGRRRASQDGGAGPDRSGWRSTSGRARRCGWPSWPPPVIEVTWGGPVGDTVEEATDSSAERGRGRGHLGGVRLARLARGGRRGGRGRPGRSVPGLTGRTGPTPRPRLTPPMGRTGCPVGPGPGGNLGAWSSAGSTACRPTSSPPSTT